MVLDNWIGFGSNNVYKIGCYVLKKVLRPKRYLEVLFGKFVAYKCKSTLKSLLNPKMVHFT